MAAAPPNAAALLQTARETLAATCDALTESGPGADPGQINSDLRSLRARPVSSGKCWSSMSVASSAVWSAASSVRPTMLRASQMLPNYGVPHTLEVKYTYTGSGSTLMSHMPGERDTPSGAFLFRIFKTLKHITEAFQTPVGCCHARPISHDREEWPLS